MGVLDDSDCEFKFICRCLSLDVCCRVPLAELVCDCVETVKAASGKLLAKLFYIPPLHVACGYDRGCAKKITIGASPLIGLNDWL